MPGVNYLLPSAVDTGISSSRLPVTETAQGTIVVHGKKIFKAGTFKDSAGVEKTWTTEELDQLVQNFHELRVTNILPGVPLRIDHSWSARDLVGWISDVYRIGPFLFADLHFTEWSAYSKWDRGTYEPVSSEIANYVTNEGDAFYPTLIGVAFVDIPAVEGLYRASGVGQEQVTAVPVDSSMLDTQAGGVYNSGQEDHMTTQQSTTASASAPGGQSTADLVAGGTTTPAADGTVPTGTAAPAPVTDPAAAGAAAAPTAPAAPAPAPVAAATPAAPAPAPAPVPEPALAAHAAQVSSAAVFSINGAPTSDFAAVQAHIVALESQVATAIDNERREYVAGLVKDNKIIANQSASLTDLALSMTADQFGKFKETFETTAANPLLQSFGENASFSQAGGTVDDTDKLRAEYETAREIVESHKRQGKSEDFVKGTNSYKRMTELASQFAG